MYKPYSYIFSFIVLCILIMPKLSFAQDQGIVAPPMPDTVVQAIDSLSASLKNDSTYEDDEEYDDEEYNNTLYFLQKNDTTSIYDSSIFKWRAVPDSVVTHLKNDDDFWYANRDLMEKKKKKEEEDAPWILRFFAKMLGSGLFRLLMWIIIIGCFAAAVFWFLRNNKMNIWGSTKGPAIVRENKEGEVDDIFSTELKTEIQKAEQASNYRLAIRFHYLHLLKKLSEHSLIKYTQDATNMEYLTQLYGKPYYNEFFKVTRNYEYAWYGETAVTEQQYKNVVEGFMQLYTKTSINF